MKSVLYTVIVHALALWGLLDLVAQAIPGGWPL